jgi:alpha-mannosidase
MLINAEKWSSIAKVVEHQPYPQDFEQAWKGVMFNQFHDILAGTSIPSAYEDASYLHGEAMAIGQRNLNYAIQAMSWDIDIDLDITMKPIVVFNSHSWSGKMAIDLEVRGLSNDNFKLTDAQGNIIPAQRVQSEATVNGQSRLLFVAELPSMGYQLFKLYLKTEEAQELSHVSITENAIENDRYKLVFNLETGCLSSFYDKKCDLEILRREGARLAVIEDKSDTWSHNIFKFDKEIANMEVVSVRIFEDGPVRSTMCVKSKFKDSYVLQYFRVYKELDYVEVKMKVDWREPQTMLKLKFPVNFNFRKPTYEIPYGYIEKSANGEEEPGQTWIDFSGEHFKNGVLYGLGIANDSKYSYSFDIDEMAVTILKNSVYAHHDPKKLDPEEEYQFVDHGVQELTYALIPHEGGWKDSDLLHRAMEINQKPISVIETFHKGNQPAAQSFVEVDRKEVVISAIKEAEDQDGIILRAYETLKHQVTATIQLPFLDRSFTLNFSPCEIKTIKVPYDKNAAVIEVNLLEL